jgi:hypothetical protein
VKTRWWIVALSVLGALVLIVWGAFSTPPVRDVHTARGTPVMTRLVWNTRYVLFQGERISPSQSLDTVRCEYWRFSQRPTTTTCPDSATLASLYFPNLTQSPRTLYVPWGGCPSGWSGSDGFNAEYLPGRRALVLHCYTAEPLVSWPRRPMMVAGQQPRPSVLLVPTDSLPVGNVSIQQDYRIEHLLGDQSYEEYPVGIATIS